MLSLHRLWESWTKAIDQALEAAQDVAQDTAVAAAVVVAVAAAVVAAVAAAVAVVAVAVPRLRGSPPKEGKSKKGRLAGDRSKNAPNLTFFNGSIPTDGFEPSTSSSIYPTSRESHKPLNPLVVGHATSCVTLH